MTSAMTTRRATTKRTPSRASRRFGYAVAILINGAMLFAVNVWPGWDVLPFLTGDFTKVLVLVNASAIASIAVNVVYVLDDRTWVKKSGDALTTAFGLAAMVVMWQVFPFDFGAATFDWALVFRILLGVGIIGSAIGILYNLVSLFTDSPSRS